LQGTFQIAADRDQILFFIGHCPYFDIPKWAL
jgi:hypothetical protein